MRRTKIYLLILLLLLPLTSVGQSNLYRNFTKDIKSDIMKLESDLHQRKEKSVILKDLQKLDYHMQMQYDMTTDDLLQLKILERYDEFYELKMACHYTIGAIYHHLGDSLKATDSMHDAISHSSPSHMKRTSLQELLIQTISFMNNIPDKMESIILGTTSVQSRVSTMKEVLHMRYSLRSLLDSPVDISKYPLVNELLAYAISLRKPSWQLEADKKKHPNTVTSEQLTLIAQLMAYTADKYINFWVENQFPAQFIIDVIKNNKFRALTNETNESICLYELSIHGYGQASHLLGLRFESGSHAKEDPEQAYECYELAAQQGCHAGIIRQAHCLAIGYGCKVNTKKAFSILKPLRNDVDFPCNGAYAYAKLIDQGIGGKADIIDMMECYSQAASEAFRKSEQTAAQERIAQLYEQYYQ